MSPRCMLGRLKPLPENKHIHTYIDAYTHCVVRQVCGRSQGGWNVEQAPFYSRGVRAAPQTLA